MKKNSSWTFSRKEKTDLLISWITLSIAFVWAVKNGFLGLPGIDMTTALMISVPIAFVAIGTGFIFHELAHRQAARHYGFISEFRMWKEGLLFALLIAFVTEGRFIFAAPGATYFFGNNVSIKQNGIISIAGPITNICVGLILLILSPLTDNIFLALIFSYSSAINFFFAFFNLLPFGPLDGTKVFIWNKGIWLATITTTGILLFLTGFL
jgi:Zn-dependent protease